MNDIYRGFEIKPVTGGFVWVDESGDDCCEGKVPYATADAVMDAIDKHKRALVAAKA